MQGDDPPYLSVGTAVSAKYKGAFCEAKVSKVVRIVKCKVTYKMGLGTATVNDDQIKGTLRVGQIVQAKHPEKKEYVDATIAKIQDCSQYTVVFDDGDITTLRRTALCLKSGRHFNESETLDQLPLTHPEHFGNPVMGGRRGRRSRQLKEDSSEGEAEEENEPDLELYSADAGKVVSVETSDKKKSKDNWFPGLIVMPSAQPTVRINVKDEFLIRSFKDGRYYTVPKKEISEFKREMGQRVESSVLAEAVNKAIKFLDQDELPVHWERSSLFNVQSQFSDSDENLSDTSDDEPTEEKDHFVAQLYKFMDDSGTPLNKTPTIAGKDVDLYRLFGLVHKLGGYNRVTNQSKWKTITTRLKFNQTQTTYNQVKQVYKKCLLSYESFYRTLGCTMMTPTRNPKKNRGRPLIRDKDRVATPVQSPKPEKEEEVEIKKEEEPKPKIKKVEKEEKKRKDENESSDNSGDTTDQSENQSTSKEVGRPKRNIEAKPKEKKKPVAGDKVKVLIEKFEEHTKKLEKEKEDEKVQQTRSKSQAPRSKDVVSPEVKTPVKDPQTKTNKSATKKVVEEEKDKDKKRGRKRNNEEKASEKASTSDSSLNDLPSAIITTSDGGVSIGDKLKVYYGPTHESKVTYEAKVIEIDTDPNGQPALLVHYTGWNTRYDEWIALNRIAENLSATTKAKRLKQQGGRGTNKPVARRGRGMSITGRSTIVDAPRSTTPSSVTSSSSRTKSPAATSTKMSSRTTRQGEATRRTRRTSAQTDVSVPTESETDERSDSEAELSRTRSGARGEETEVKTYRKKLTKTKPEKRKEDEDTEKEEDTERPKRAKKLKKVAEVKAIEDTDDEEGSNSNQPKGREFDLNQIRSELKGFGKAIKLANSDTTDKDVGSSDESSSLQITKNFTDVEPTESEEKAVEKCESSDDIYEFKEPEPFEFETRKIAEDKGKKRIPRLFEEAEKSPKKKLAKTPPKNDFESEKKTPTKKTPVKKVEEEEEEKPKIEEIKSDDPFDKLVESPSFNTGKCSVINKVENNPVCKVLNMDEPLEMFEMPEPLEDSEDRLEISDSEDRQAPVSFSHPPSLFLPSAFDKTNVILETACDSFETKLDDCKLKDSEDDDDSIRASIQRVIEQTSLDDESNDTLLDDKPKYFEACKLNESKASTSNLFTTPEIPEEKDEVITSQEIIENLPKQIISVFQESDSSLLKDLCATPQIITKIEDLKDITIKTGTKIADTILQKFSLINKSIEESVKSEDFKSSDEEDDKIEEKVVKLDNVDLEEKNVNVFKEVIEEVKKEDEIEPVEIKIEEEIKLDVIDINKDLDTKKRPLKKFVSKEYIDDTDTDSDSDSEQRLVIARSDEDSQTSISFDAKVDNKESDSNISNPSQIEDSQSQDEKSNFKFENLVDSQCEDIILEDTSKNDELENVKEEEPDSHLHSMLLCEETIPGSPAPATPQNEPKVKSKNILEMPFASAPSSSNNKSCIQQEKMKERKENPPLPILPIDNRDARDVSTVLDNTPPTTPESTISNLSPRGEIGGLSPNNADNESCKSNEADNDYISQRRTSLNKSSAYSEDDSLLNTESQSSIKKGREDLPSPCKKRRRSCKMENDVIIPAKRGRKPNRSQHNSDSDDTSEHSMPSMSTNLDPTRISRSPRPSKYNFFVEFDPSLDAPARIAMLQQRLQDLRKTYANVKAELVTIERRRKKIRRREREAIKAAKQEYACT